MLRYDAEVCRKTVQRGGRFDGDSEKNPEQLDFYDLSSWAQFFLQNKSSVSPGLRGGPVPLSPPRRAPKKVRDFMTLLPQFTAGLFSSLPPHNLLPAPLKSCKVWRDFDCRCLSCTRHR